jgi:saccharopine dehydrogenase-like NADP-dependent oxidoreductase
MKTILVLGAGRSSSSLINYLLREGEKSGWRIIVGDFYQISAIERIGKSAIAEAVAFDINDDESSNRTINKADVVISLLPASLHPLVAKHCLNLNKHMLTASYVSDEMEALGNEAKFKDLLFLNECGLDPGIDHMSAMQIIEKIKGDTGKIISFESFTGGLIAPETDFENPWRYKFTWNSRNVVLAGQSTAKYLSGGEYKYIPYQQLFLRTTPVHVEGYGDYEGYANRDSLKYINTYGLHDVKTMLRGTLRHKGFCSAWNIFVQLGCCDDTYLMDNVSALTHSDFLNAFLDYHPSKSVEEKLIDQMHLKRDGSEIQKLKWSGLFDDTLVGLDKGTPAQILEHILNKKWKLQAGDKDMIVMWHRFVYEENNRRKEIHASLVAKGNDAIETAMAKTVGLPLGIATKLLLEGKIKQRGVVIPIAKEIYEPILNALKSFGIALLEKEVNQ